jgi:hypothetical protein
VVIKSLLGIGLAALVVTILRHRNAMRFQAGKKILLAAFVAAFVVSLADPGITSHAARVVGVGRGADLLLYATVVAFLFVALNTYLKFKDYDARIATLSRRIALDEAARRDAVTGDGAPHPPTRRSSAPH